MLGYSSVNSSLLTMRGSNVSIEPPTKDTPAMWRMYQKKQSNLMKEFSSCPINGNYSVVHLTCSNFGKINTDDAICDKLQEPIFTFFEIFFTQNAVKFVIAD